MRYPLGRLGTQPAGLEPVSPSLLLSRRQIMAIWFAKWNLSFEFDLQIELPNGQIKPHSRIVICPRLNRSDRGAGSRPARRVPSQPSGFLITRRVLENATGMEKPAGRNRRSTAQVSPPGLSLPGPTFQTRPGTSGPNSTFVRLWLGCSGWMPGCQRWRRCFCRLTERNA